MGPAAGAAALPQRVLQTDGPRPDPSARDARDGHARPRRPGLSNACSVWARAGCFQCGILPAPRHSTSKGNITAAFHGISLQFHADSGSGSTHPEP